MPANEFREFVKGLQHDFRDIRDEYEHIGILSCDVIFHKKIETAKLLDECIAIYEINRGIPYPIDHGKVPLQAINNMIVGYMELKDEIMLLMMSNTIAHHLGAGKIRLYSSKIHHLLNKMYEVI